MKHFFDNIPRLSGSHYSPIFLSLIILFLSIVFYYFSVLSIDLENTSFLNYYPSPDAVEYLALTKNFIEEREFYIQIGNDILPSRYPPGYPFIVAFFASWIKKPLFELPFVTNQIIGFFIIMGVFIFYFFQKRYLAASLIVALVTTCPAFVIYSRAPLSELPSLAVLLLVILLIHLSSQKNRLFLLYFAFFLLGLTVTIRTQFLFWGVLLFLPILRQSEKKCRKRDVWYSFITNVVFFTLGLLPYFIFNMKWFGSPLKNGYDYWVPGSSGLAVFSFSHIAKHLRNIYISCVSTNNSFDVANLYGPGQYYSLAFLILIIFSIVFSVFFVKTNRAHLIPYLIVFFITCSYKFISLRFFFPLIILSMFPVVTGLEFAIKNGKKGYCFICIPLLFFSLVGMPSISGWPPQFTFSQSIDLATKRKVGISSHWFRTVNLLVSKQAFFNESVLVISPLSPVYLNSLLPGKYRAIPADENHDYRQSKAYNFRRGHIISHINKALNVNQEVVFVNYPFKEIDLEYIKTLIPDDYDWLPKLSDESSDDNILVAVKRDQLEDVDKRWSPMVGPFRAPFKLKSLIYLGSLLQGSNSW